LITREHHVEAARAQQNVTMARLVPITPIPGVRNKRRLPFAR
jgi:hypothetical protein